MIVVSMMGGLGNQMFQYAFGRGVSTALGRSLVLDLTMMPTGMSPYERPYALEQMPLHESVRFAGRFGDTAGLSRPRPQIARVGRIVRSGLRRWTVIEPRNDVLLPVEQIPSHLAVCIGYWQSPQYFEFIDEDIRRELKPSVVSGGRVEQLLTKTDGSARIAVHVRRGDYSTDAKVLEVHGIQSAHYYEQAVGKMLGEIRGPATVIVLSEDPSWCEENLKFSARTVHAEADGPLVAQEALSLMSRCNYHVIANSSLSWWGAWLAGKSANRVIYPSKWFASRPVNRDFRFPNNWEPC